MKIKPVFALLLCMIFSSNHVYSQCGPNEWKKYIKADRSLNNNKSSRVYYCEIPTTYDTVILESVIDCSFIGTSENLNPFTQEEDPNFKNSIPEEYADSPGRIDCYNSHRGAKCRLVHMRCLGPMCVTFQEMQMEKAVANSGEPTNNYKLNEDVEYYKDASTSNSPAPPDAHGSWTTMATTPVATFFGTAVGYTRNDTGFLFCFGGNNFTSRVVTRYNVTTDTWAIMDTMPKGRILLASALIGDDVFIIGGDDTGPTKEVFKYSILQDSWSQVADLPVSLAWNKAVAVRDSLIYVVGGYDGVNALATTYVYNVNADSWSTATSLPALRFGGALSHVGDTLVYIAGADLANLYSTTFVGEISPTNNSIIVWNQVTDYPLGIMYRFDAHPWGSQGVIVSGGSPVATLTGDKSCYTYRVCADQWTKQPDLPALVMGSSSGSIELTNKTWKLISAAGYNAGYLLDTEVYTDNISEIVVPPFQVNPPDGITDVNAPTLEWLAVAGATYYRVQLALDSNFLTIILDTTFFLLTTLNVPANEIYGNSTFYWRVSGLGGCGDSPFSTGWSFTTGDFFGIDDPDKYIINLEPNYPNPFSSETIISYSISHDGFVDLRLYDILGKEVAQLVQEKKPAGQHFIVFDKTNLDGGIYFYTLKTGLLQQTRKMIVLQ